MTKVRNVSMGLLVSVVLTGVASCGGGGGGYGGGGGGGTATVVRSASLTGAQEVTTPVNPGSGRGAVVVNPTTMEITGGVTFTGLTGAPADARIYQGAIGVDGTDIITLVLGSDNATVPPGTILTGPQLTALQANGLYFNVKTAANANGEIRGQLSIQGSVMAGLATLNAAQQVPTNGSVAVGRGTVVVDSVTREILISYMTHNVNASTMAHIHTGVSGTNGIVKVNHVAQGATLWTAPAGFMMDAQDMSDFAINYLYFNIHSAPPLDGGEIRGQIAVQ